MSHVFQSSQARVPIPDVLPPPEPTPFEHAYASGTTLKRTLRTPDGVDRLLFFPFSCVMPESTNWENNKLPRFKKQPNTWRVLLVLGNVAHFAGNMPQLFFASLLKLSDDWEHFIYVPGPYDYGGGLMGGATLELGDSYLRELSELDPRLSVFAFNCPMTSIYFTGPRILVRGAACFPVEPEHYEKALVCMRAQPYVPKPGDARRSGLDAAADREAVEQGRWVTQERAQFRLDKDVETLLKVTEPAALGHVIVSYGCPDEIAAATRKKSAFHATVKLGNASVYKRFADLGAMY